MPGLLMGTIVVLMLVSLFTGLCSWLFFKVREKKLGFTAIGIGAWCIITVIVLVVETKVF